MRKLILKNGKIINEGSIEEKDILIVNDKIEKIDNDISDASGEVIDAEGKFVIPGIIDDQVHFREPGLTRKAEIFTESRAAVAGGVTSFMEMPNTIPPAITLELLEEKYKTASQRSIANYSFYMGTSNDNPDEALKINPKQVCGIKIFMGGSTGNMLVDDNTTLTKLFSEAPSLIAIHSENDPMIKENLQRYIQKYGEDIPIDAHADIRNVEVCYSNTKNAVELAKKYGTRLHILHISTEEELEFFRNDISIQDKNITSEACVHHLYFDRKDYDDLGSQIKCNPAIKEERHRKAILQAILDDKIDVIATDHAPHTWEEKQKKYNRAPSGIPLVQHSLNIMLDLYRQGKISLTKIVEKMCHAPAELFRIENRGYLREGYFADIAVLDLNKKWRVNKENLFYKCGWSPFEGIIFKGYVEQTFVNGNKVYENGNFAENIFGERLTFNI